MEGTVKASPFFDSEADAKALKTALKRFGKSAASSILPNFKYRIYSNRGRVLIEACLIYKPGFMFSFQNRGLYFIALN